MLQRVIWPVIEGVGRSSMYLHRGLAGSVVTTAMPGEIVVGEALLRTDQARLVLVPVLPLDTRARDLAQRLDGNMTWDTSWS